MCVSGIGIDTVELKKARRFLTISPVRLRRFFSEEELTYAFSHRGLCVERLAARFAAKEAFYKALMTAYPKGRMSLLTMSEHVSVSLTEQGAPELSIAWHQLPWIKDDHVYTLLSMTHTETQATAIVILGKKEC
ncbi:MAG: 4'-phosphopantetheinyl transferase superfamily protein [Candidatus Babeliales bacterium]